MRARGDADHCFVCGPHNPRGLQIAFRLESEMCIGRFTPGEHHMGFDRVTHGGIVFTGSTSGQFGTPLRAPYVAAKWAVNGLMKTVAMEAGPFGIRANVIAPGCVEGPRIERVIEREAAAKGTTPAQVRAAYEAGTSLRTFVTAGDVAAMAVYLASPAGERISGQVITLDGHTENPDPKV